MNTNRISKEESNSIIMYILSTLIMYLVVMKILGLYTPYVPKYICSRIIEIIDGFLLIVFLEYTEFKIYRTGLIATRTEIKRTIIRCGIICIGIILIFLLARLIMTSFDPSITSRSWFKPYFRYYMRWYYPFVAIIQEVFSKAVMQENVKRLFGEDNAKWSIVACSFIFALYHVNYPLYYIVAAGLLNYFTGLIYEKDHSIWGCSMIHFCVGFLPRAIGLK